MRSSVEIAKGLAVIGMYLLAIYLAVRLGPVVYDYRFTKAGISIVCLMGHLTIFHFGKETIKEAQVIGIWKCFFVGQFGLHLGNRYKKRLMIVRLRGFPWTMTLTPDDPDAAVRALGL